MIQKALNISGEEHIADAAEHNAEYVRKHHRKSESHRHHHRNRHRNHQDRHADQQRQSRSTVEEDRIDIYNVQQQHQLKQSSRPVKTGPPTKPKPNVALSRKSASKNNWLIYFLANDNLRFI